MPLSKTFYLFQITTLCLIFFNLTSFAQPYKNLEKLDDRLKADKNGKMNNVTNYSCDCLITNFIDQGKYFSYLAEKDLVVSAPENISSDEENKYGEKVLKDILSNVTILNNDKSKAIDLLLNSILRSRPEKKSGLVYHIHLIEDTTINAFTAGGQIFIYTGMLKYCKSLSEIAFVIAHEVAHNELKHINLQLKRIKLAGDFAGLMCTFKEMTAMSFNQYDEVEADFYASDLIYAAGFNPVKGALLWKRMASDMRENVSWENSFLRTHPYSIDRYNCINVYLKTKYNLNTN